MALILPDQFSRITDSNGNPVSGGKLKVFLANTSSLATVYTNAAGSVAAANPIVADSSGLLPNRFLADNTYDFEWLDASNVRLDFHEDIVVSTSGGGGGGSGKVYKVVSKTSNYAVAPSDVAGQVPIFLVDASGIPGLEAIITISAATLLADAGLMVINASATGTVRVQPGIGETIDGAADVALIGQGRGQQFACIGAAGWQTISSTTVGLPAGGDAGDALVKNTGTNFDAAWKKRREVLTGNRTYFVRTDGNDSNDGSANTTGGAFLTIQKAVNVAAGLDFNGFTVTIQINTGTYTGSVVIPSGLREADRLIIQGNTGTPGNVIWSVTNGDCITATDGAQVTVQGVEFRTTTSGHCVVADRGALIKLGVVNFGACANRHMSSSYGALIKATANYTINGDATNHFNASAAGEIDASGLSITLSGSRAFSIWALSQSNAYITVGATSYTGSATGLRMTVATGGGFNTGGVTQPGNSAGSTTTPGWSN